MGMYDYVRIDPELLPVSKKDRKLLTKQATNGTFQTKDGECRLSCFDIRSDKSLWIEGYCYDREADREPVFLADFSGDINFYTFEWTSRGNEWWFEFKAVFVSGKMIYIKLVEREFKKK